MLGGMTHDPLCDSDDDPYNCKCDLIAKVRADERARALTPIPGSPFGDDFSCCR